jgi:hypothetical protein
MKIILGFLLLVGIPVHSQDQQSPGLEMMDRCVAMQGKARHDCLLQADRIIRTEKAARLATTTYHIILYTPSGEQSWQAHEIFQAVSGELEFVDSTSQHRYRISGTYLIESSTSEIVETGKDDDED